MKRSVFDKILIELNEASEDKDIARMVTYASQNDLALNEVASLAKKLAFTGSSLPGSANITADRAFNRRAFISVHANLSLVPEVEGLYGPQASRSW